MVSLHSVGNFVSSFFAGALAEKIGRKRSILIFNSAFACSYLIILLSGNVPLLVLAFVMTGLARGATSNFCNTVINNLAPGKAGLINSESMGMIVFGIMAFGFSMAGIYPTTVSFSGNLIQKYSLAWSFILIFASLGSILMPTIIGAIAGSYGIFAGMCSVGVVIAIDLVCILALIRYVKMQEN